MDWTVMAELGKYLPWILAEAGHHPTVRDWAMQAKGSFPMADYEAIRRDVAANTGHLPPVTDVASAVQYLPFVFSEMVKHPAVSAWLQQTITAMPAKEVSQVIGDAQLNAKQWSM
jgi:hypothetical protein